MSATNTHALIYSGVIAGAALILWRARSAPSSAPAVSASSAMVTPSAFQSPQQVNSFQTINAPTQGQYYPLALGYMPLFGFVGVRAF